MTCNAIIFWFMTKRSFEVKFDRKMRINELTHLIKKCKWLNIKSWWLKSYYMIKWKNYFFQILHTFLFQKLHWFRPTNSKEKSLYEICIKISFKSKSSIKTSVKSMKNMNCRWLNTIRCNHFFNSISHLSTWCKLTISKKSLHEFNIFDWIIVDLRWLISFAIKKTLKWFNQKYLKRLNALHMLSVKCIV